MVNFGLRTAEICWRVWGTPANFNEFRVLTALTALLHSTLVVGISQTLRRWTEGATYIRQGGHHGNATRAPIANPPNNAQLGGIPYHFAKLHPGPCNSVGMRPQTVAQTHTYRHPDARDHNTFRVVYNSREM